MENLKYLIRNILLEAEDKKSNLENMYFTDNPEYLHQVDHNKAVKYPRLQSWKIAQKKYFIENADHEWFNKNFTFVHWLGHSAGINRSQLSQLRSSLGHMKKNLTWEYDNMSAYGYKKESFLSSIARKNTIGIMMQECKIGYAAMADMWTEEHWTLRDPVHGDSTRNFYMNRYKSAMGIPKRPGFFDPKMAFLDEETYNIVIGLDEFTGDPETIDEVICERWKLHKILISKDSVFKDDVYHLLEEHGYDTKQTILEY
jgi:hypothetical protein